MNTHGHGPSQTKEGKKETVFKDIRTDRYMKTQTIGHEHTNSLTET